jgi:hypothetical protein
LKRAGRVPALAGSIPGLFAAFVLCTARPVWELSRENLLLLVYEGVNLSGEQLVDIPGEVLHFATRPTLKDAMAKPRSDCIFPCGVI